MPNGRDPWFHVRHYLNVLGSGLSVVAAAIWGLWWIVPIFAIFTVWSVRKLRGASASD